MAFDAIETPFGKIDKIVGGSATYVAYAAINFVQPVQQISIVGNDFPQEELNELKKRGVQLEGVEIVPDIKIFFLERPLPRGHEYPGYPGHRPECTCRF
jgi:sugar/nucleoside kinase (ribokinase family)